MNKKTFGQALSPVLENIEKEIWKFEFDGNGLRPGYTKSGVKGAIKIFMSVFLDQMYKNQELLNTPVKKRAKQAEKAGLDLRKLTLDNTGIDTHNLYKK